MFFVENMYVIVENSYVVVENVYVIVETSLREWLWEVKYVVHLPSYDDKFVNTNLAIGKTQYL